MLRPCVDVLDRSSGMRPVFHAGFRSTRRDVTLIIVHPGNEIKSFPLTTMWDELTTGVAMRQGKAMTFQQSGHILVLT
jgi:hypothetical protein